MSAYISNILLYFLLMYFKAFVAVLNNIILSEFF